jgi:hypothetical protein
VAARRAQSFRTVGQRKKNTDPSKRGQHFMPLNNAVDEAVTQGHSGGSHDVRMTGARSLVHHDG